MTKAAVNQVQSIPPQVAELRHREAVTAAVIENLDHKLARLHNARNERATALSKIRSVLARANVAGPNAPEIYEHTPNRN